MEACKRLAVMDFRVNLEKKNIYIVATKIKRVAAMYFFVKKRKRGMWKRWICLTLLLVLFLVNLRPVWAYAEELSLYATAAVLMDADTGRVLYGKNADEFMSNASTTKILTCIVALENASLDEVVETSAYAASMPKVKLYIKVGEHYRLEDLLYSLMLESHNDSAVAIAEHVGGSMEGFAKMMNEKAAEIGCENTWFITPNGLDATQSMTDEAGNVLELSHGTTAEDLAKIMAYCAFESPAAETFLQITRTASYSFTNEEGRSFSCTNHNAFLNMMEGALTGKTGFTNKAGYCYVGALERDGKRFTIALLACGWPNNKTYKWADSKTLFSYGLDNYVYHGINEVSYDETILSPIPVENGRTDKLEETAYAQVLVENEATIYEGMLLATDEKIEVQTQVVEKLTAPVTAGTKVGSIRYMVGDICLKEEKIVVQNTVKEIDFFWCIHLMIQKYVL